MEKVIFGKLEKNNLLNINKGNDLIIRVRNIMILATTDGLVIEGDGFRIHEPEIVGIIK